MNKEQLAEALNGIEYPFDLSEDDAAAAKAAGLVVVFGASDDLMEFRGAIYDELGAIDGTTVYIVDGELWQGAGCDHRGGGCKWAKAAEEAAQGRGWRIDALWCAEGDYSWTYKTEIPHATFEIVEDGQPYCKGIVFALEEAK